MLHHNTTQHIILTLLTQFQEGLLAYHHFASVDHSNVVERAIIFCNLNTQLIGVQHYQLISNSHVKHASKVLI